MLMQRIKNIRFTDWILLAAFLLIGGYYEFISCLLSVAMCLYLLIRIRKEKQLFYRGGLRSAAVWAICIGYGVTALWGIDGGMSLIGFLKFLPLGLYVLCLWQEEKESQVLGILPYFGAAVSVISAAGMQFPAWESWFSVAGRLAGCFQYPNTFAAFLLICQMLLLKKNGKRIWDYAVLLVLLAAMLYTGSRTVLVLSVAAYGVMLLALGKERILGVLRNKKLRYALLGVLVAGVVAVVLFSLDENSVLRRYLNITLNQSTLVGRILYVVDALPLLLKYPFGMGYMGYFYVQGSIQTGVYSTAYVHNDFMQVFLDTGWVPGVLLVAALIAWFVKKDVPLEDKVVAGVLCAHSFFDFNLQYISMFMLLFLLIDGKEPCKKLRLKKAIPMKTGLILVSVAGLYMAVSLSLAYFGYVGLSDTLYPYNTQNRLKILEGTTDLEQANALADEILEQNQHYYTPYSIKAKYSYAQGNMGDLVKYKEKVFECDPFVYGEYEEYCEMMIYLYNLYKTNGEPEGAQACVQQIVNTKDRIFANAQRLSPLGWKMPSLPVTRLPDEIIDFLNSVQNPQ